MVSLQPLSALPVVGVLADGGTYRHLLYLLIAIPIGFVYSMLFSFGFLFGLLFSVVLVGLVILLATLLGARIAAGFERWLANRLLGTDLDRYDDVPDDAGGAVANVRKYVDAASTWRGVGFLSLKYFVTVVAFVPLFALAYGLPLLLAPLRYPYAVDFGESNGEPVTWAIETPPEAILAVAVGLVAVLAALHLTNLVAYVCRQMATALLGEPAVANSAGATGAADAADGTDATSPVEVPASSDTGPTAADLSDTGSTAADPSDPNSTESDPLGTESTETKSTVSESDADPLATDEFIPADAVEPDSDDGSDRSDDDA